MLQILQIVLPIFALVGIGLASHRLGWLATGTLSHLNRYVFQLALPALLLELIWSASREQILHPRFALLIVGPVLVILALGIILGRVLGLRASPVTTGFSAANINSAIIGIPLCLTAFGPAAAAPAALTNVLIGCGLYPLVLLLYEIESGSGIGWRALAIRIARNPLFAACIAGLMLTLAQVPLPALAGDVLGILGASTMPCALVALGIFLSGTRLRHEIGLPVCLSALKLVAHPAAAFALASVLAVPLVWKQVAVLMAAMPTAAGTFLVVEAMGKPVEVAGQTILLTTLLGLVTLPAWLYLLGA